MVGVDEAISAAGHEPNGYFWEGMVQYLAPGLADQMELDSEAGMFVAYGERADTVASGDSADPLQPRAAPGRVDDLRVRLAQSGCGVNLLGRSR